MNELKEYEDKLNKRITEKVIDELIGKMKYNPVSKVFEIKLEEIEKYKKIDNNSWELNKVIKVVVYVGILGLGIGYLIGYFVMRSYYL